MDTEQISVMRRELARMEARAVRQRKILEDTEVMVTLMRQQVADAEAVALAATRKK